VTQVLDLLTMSLTFRVLDLAFWFGGLFALGAFVTARRGR
jgi:hypothetical protein